MVLTFFNLQLGSIVTLLAGLDPDNSLANTLLFLICLCPVSKKIKIKEDSASKEAKY